MTDALIAAGVTIVVLAAIVLYLLHCLYEMFKGF